MTDQVGRRARWTAALIVAPGAAAVFGTATSWAMHTVPITASAAPQSPAPTQATRPAGTRASTRDVTTLQHSVAANRREIAALRGRLEKLRTVLHGELQALAAPPQAPPDSTGATGSVAAAPPAADRPQPAGRPPVVTPQAAPAPAPPPPVHATTGGSGAPR